MLPAEKQASLRETMLAQIDGAQAAIESQLLDLRRNGVSADPQVIARISGQLAMLTVLRNSVDGASPATLAQLQQAVSIAVAAAGNSAEQAYAGNEPANGRDAAYAAATAELDRKVAATFAIDQANEDDAHKFADKYGVDLAELDAERKRLEVERAAAVARGDMVAVRRLDIATSQLTQDALLAVEPFVTDPAEKAALAADIKAGDDVIAVRTSALDDQKALEASRSVDVPPAPAPQTQAVAPDMGFAAFASGLALGGTAQIALSDAPDAHTKVEVPQVARKGSGSSLGGIGSP